MQQMTGQAHEAALAEDWPAAIRLAGGAYEEAERVLADIVNLARTVGGLTDEQVGELRGVTRSAIQQRFGSRSRLLKDAMVKRWEAAQDEWRQRPG